MRDVIEIATKGALDADVVVPGSKSITHRTLFCAALADGVSVIRNALFCADTEITAACLRALGAEIEGAPDDARFKVTGFNGLLKKGDGALNAGESGTTLRFLTALLTLGRDEYTLEGGEVPRPIGDLASALNEAGCVIRYVDREGYPPLKIRGTGFPGGKIRVSGSVSSQYVSAILLAAPYAQQDTEVEITGARVSAPYIDITIDVMRAFAVDVAFADNVYYVPADFGYEATDFHVEGDASAAMYFLAAAGICGGRVRVAGVGSASRQADVRFASLLKEMGCGVTLGEHSIEATGPVVHGIHADMRDMPDSVPTLAAVACFAESKTLITGIANLRHKESDRVAATAEALGALGARIETGADSIEIYPSKMHGGKVEPRDDHRIAMSAALVGLRTPEVIISNPKCVAKSFPDFFAAIENLSERSKS